VCPLTANNINALKNTKKLMLGKPSNAPKHPTAGFKAHAVYEKEF